MVVQAFGKWGTITNVAKAIIDIFKAQDLL